MRLLTILTLTCAVMLGAQDATKSKAPAKKAPAKKAAKKR